MIRFVSAASLVALLFLVLYLPSAYPPERFIDQLRAEHALTIEFWEHEHAMRILSRMLDWQTTAKQASPAPFATGAPAPGPIDVAVAKQMAEVNQRLFHNPYFRSIDTLLALATYRFSVLIEWLPVLLVLMLAALFDGYLVRIVKSQEFVQHNPEVFALHAGATIMTACAAVLALVLPITLHPLMLSGVPVAISVFASRALANFHRRG
ncbi:MAG TPA: DUF4400 domain-containing protein [Noviherbaspirillum sp.]